MTTLAEDYPRMQERVRELLEQYIETSKMPRVNCSFAIAGIKATLREADEAAMSGDVVRMLRAYNEMKECQ